MMSAMDASQEKNTEFAQYLNMSQHHHQKKKHGHQKHSGPHQKFQCEKSLKYPEKFIQESFL